MKLYGYMIGCCLFLLAFSAAFASEPSIETLPPLAREMTTATLPRDGRGGWREEAQKIWISAERRLEGRRYRIFDPFLDSRYDIFWEPFDIDTDTPGELNGRGMLTWRPKGHARHGTEFIVAQYRGGMRNGRFHGPGSFLNSDGVRYDGAWVDGLMQGQGSLLLPNSDVYKGDFLSGLAHGHGIYIDAAGRTYEGGFEGGLRSGPGHWAAVDDGTFASVWAADVEQPTRRSPASAAWADLHRIQAVTGRSASGLVMAVGVTSLPQFCCDAGGPILGYTATSHTDRIEIFPDSPEIMDGWFGRANVVVDDPHGFDWARMNTVTFTYLNYLAERIRPLPLEFRLENRSRSSAAVVSGYLDIAESVSEMRPALQVTEVEAVEPQIIDFQIENYGWATARNAVLSLTLRDNTRRQQGSSFSINLGDLSASKRFSMRDGLAAAGISRQALSRMAKGCATLRVTTSPEDGDDYDKECLAALRRSGLLGQLADMVFVKERTFGVRAVGTLSFKWTDAEGKEQTGTSPFDAYLTLGSFFSGAECEGGDVKDIKNGEPFKLSLDRKSYRIPFTLNDSVTAAAVGRWRLLLDADKSSRHSLRIVLQLADGNEVASRRLNILYYKPKTRKGGQSRSDRPRC